MKTLFTYILLYFFFDVLLVPVGYFWRYSQFLTYLLYAIAIIFGLLVGKYESKVKKLL